MRRLHLRGHGNIQKRLLIHIAGLNLGLVMRQLTGIGKPRGAPGAAFGPFLPALGALRLFRRLLRAIVGPKISLLSTRHSDSTRVEVYDQEPRPAFGG